MENEKKLNSKKKNTMLVIGGVIVLAVIIAIVLTMPKNKQVVDENGNIIQTPGQGDVASPGGEGNTPGEEGSATSTELVEAGTEVNPVLQGAVTQAPGADLVTTDGQVVNQEGIAVETGGGYDNPNAPTQTQVIDIEEVVPEATKLTLDANGFNPQTFKIGAGQALTVSLTGSADSSHVFTFESDKLNSIYINVRPGETRAVTFNAPNEPGEYVFFCDFPGHRGRGEQGTMIVE